MKLLCQEEPQSKWQQTSGHHGKSLSTKYQLLIEYKLSELDKLSSKATEATRSNIIGGSSRWVLNTEAESSWLLLINTTSSPVKARDVSNLIKSIHAEIRKHNLEYGLAQISRELFQIRLNTVSVEMLLGFIRGTCIWADKISDWKYFIELVKEELTTRKLDHKKLLMGIE